MATISDDAVRGKTGKTWSEWFAVLDEAGAAQMNHKEIVALLREDHDVDAWWQQSVAVAYEQARRLRERHESPEGFQVSSSKTMNVPISLAYNAWANDRERLTWLPEDHLIISTARRDKTIRGTWAGGPTRLDVYFYPKGADKTQVTVNHRQLEDAAAAEQMKAFWRERLGMLEKHIRHPEE